MMLETLLVHVEPGIYRWRATAIRMDDDDVWHTFLSWGDEDRHLSPLETDFAPGRFALEGEEMLAKLIVLLGRPWAEVWDEPLDVLGFQARALAGLTDEMLQHIARTPITIIQSWAQGGTLSEGELLRATVTGDDLLCLRS